MRVVKSETETEPGHTFLRSLKCLRAVRPSLRKILVHREVTSIVKRNLSVVCVSWEGEIVQELYGMGGV